MQERVSRSLSVFLVGPMGVGKTTIGKQLAKSLGLEFIDSDHEIVERTGAAIPLIFDVEGEAGFRKRERAVVEELTRRRRVVLATGGGVVLDKRNRDCLARRGIVVYLSASVNHLYQRTARDKNRPLLQADDPMARIEALVRERDPLYREVADIVLDTGQDSIRTVVRTLTELIRRVAKHKKIDKAPGRAAELEKLKRL